MKNILRRFLLGLMILTPGLIIAAKPVFLITPVQKAPDTIYAGQTVTAIYMIKNNTPYVLNNNGLIKLPEGVTQTGGSCANRFNLAPEGSCTVTLVITADKLRGDLKGGPVVCNTLDHPVYCSSPSIGNGLNVKNNPNAPPVTKFTIGGTLAGLTASGLVLRNNGTDDLSVPAGATSFQFPMQMTKGGSYNVTVAQQPSGLVCTVSNGSGTNIMANVTNVSINCTTAFTIGGNNITGLNTTGLVLRNNGGDDLSVPSGATSFQFPIPVAEGSNYNVTVAQQPQGGLICTVNYGSGVVVNADVTNITIVCSSTTYTIGGNNITGLNTTGLVLRNNGGDDLSVPSGAASFQFPTPVAEGSNYNVTVAQQPQGGLICTVNNGLGMNVSANVTNISITCNTNTFTIGGNTIIGLTNDGLVLSNNGSDDLSVPAGAASFQFPTQVAEGSSYNVTITQQPADSFCTVTNGSGTNVMNDVTNIILNCRPQLAYVTNNGNNTISFCEINSANGHLQNCTNTPGFNGPQDIVFNNSGNSAYVTNRASDNVFRCDVNSITGLLSNCIQTGSGFITPEGIVLNNNNTRAYVTNDVSNTVLTCEVNSGNGVLFNCASTGSNFMGPVAIVLNNNNTRAYVANLTQVGVTLCSINGSGQFVNCTITGQNLTDLLSGIKLNADNSKAYVSSSATGDVKLCDVNSGDGTLTNCHPTGSGFSGPEGITLSKDNINAYINNGFANNTVICVINALNGELSSCAVAGTGFSDPQGVYYIPKQLQTTGF